MKKMYMKALCMSIALCALFTSNAMETVKEALVSPAAQICGATAATLLGGKALHSIISAMISPEHYGISTDAPLMSLERIKKPLQSFYYTIRTNPLFAFCPLATITMAARLGNTIPKLDFAQVKPMLFSALAGTMALSACWGIASYMRYNFQKDMEEKDQKDKLDHKCFMTFLGEKIYTKLHAVHNGATVFNIAYIVTGIAVPAYIIYERYTQLQ